MTLPGYDEVLGNKICTKCGEKKSLSEFSPFKEGKDGRHTICRPCRRAYMRAKAREGMSDNSFVYFIQDSWGNIKIGVAQDVERRLRGVQSNNSMPVVLLAIERGGHRRESELHEHFDCLRIHDGETLAAGAREWFRPGRELMSYINELIWASEVWEDLHDKD